MLAIVFVLNIYGFNIGKSLVGIKDPQPSQKSITEDSNSSQALTDAKIMSALLEAANQENLKAPLYIDQDTRLDRVSVAPNKKITYHHTLRNYRKSELELTKPDLEQVARNNIIPSVCYDESMKKGLAMGVIYSYAYSSADGLDLFRVTINTEVCEDIELFYPPPENKNNKHPSIDHIQVTQ